MTKKDVKQSQKIIADKIATAKSMLTKVKSDVASYFSAPSYAALVA